MQQAVISHGGHGAASGGAALDDSQAAAVEAASEGRAREVLRTVLSLSPGDFVIHADHGLGRLVGLQTIGTEGAHDLFEVEYRDGKLLVPVTEARLLSRLGSSDTAVRLDRLGGRMKTAED